MRLCWNAIVKNESARIERCVKSLLPFVDCAVIVDTGSTDNTCSLILDKFEKAGKPVEIHTAPFVDFSQARNEALRRARESKIHWDYLLLADADMELVVKQSDCWPNGQGGLAYDMEQKAGNLTYWNRRLVAREAIGEYRSPTHEYLDIPASGKIEGAYFIDHADGANRPDKIDRDIEILTKTLGIETNLGLIQRMTFYLAQSYFDKQDWDKAAELYKRRVALGGWDEEVWYAQMRLAHCYGKQGREADFLREMLRAYSMRPQRVETLYEMAKYFRERGDNFASLLFSEPGLAQSNAGNSNDLLFVDEYARTGLKEEFAICAYYDERRRRTGGKEANELALAGSEQARANLFWYAQSLSEAVPSFKPTQIPFQPPEGWAAMNPSVINHDGQPITLVRTVNYRITPEGQYVSRQGDVTADGIPIIRTRNFISSNDGVWGELASPANWPSPQFDLVRGFEDSRVFQWRGQFYTLSTVRELTHTGWCEQVLARFDLDTSQAKTDWRQILPKHRVHEKNWMPWVRGSELVFVYRLGTLINLDGEVVENHAPKWSVGHISGGSQVIGTVSNLYLAVVHEARTIPGRVNRYYQHRFVLMKYDGTVEAISPPFFFEKREQIEFCAGLAAFGGKLMVSYGLRDEEAWTATMDVFEVLRFIG